MCFVQPTPSVPASTPPPTIQQGVKAGVAKRQQIAGDQSTTNVTGGLGDTSQASTYKSKLGQ